MVTALECCQEGCEFKPYLKHSSLKKIPGLGIERHMTSADAISDKLVWILFFSNVDSS